MNRNCLRCDNKMISGCKVSTKSSIIISPELNLNDTKTYEISIKKKKGDGLLDLAKETVKAAICPKCGTVEYYVENYEEFL